MKKKKARNKNKSKSNEFYNYPDACMSINTNNLVTTNLYR